MKRVLYLFSLAFCISLFISCQQAPLLSISGPRSYTFTRDGGTESFSFTCNRDWSISTTEDWISVSPSSGTASEEGAIVTIKCNPNTTYDSRTATLTVMAEDLAEAITINQMQVDYLSVSPTSFELSNAEQSIVIEIKDNVIYTVVIPDDAKNWISVQSNTQTKALVDDKVSLAIAQNTTYDDREVAVIIKQVDGPMVGTVIIKQAYREGLIVENTAFEIDREGGTIEVAVQANVEYEVAPKVDWIHYIETKALTNSTVVLMVDENPGYTPREATVTIMQKTGDLVSDVVVKQSPFGSVEFEGYMYKTIKYGDRLWFAENLRAKFGYEEGEQVNSNGDVIWPSYVGSPWTEIDGELAYSLEFIAYNGNMKGKSVCPDGWHISTADDWQGLFSLSKSPSAPPFIKEDLGGTNEFSFGGNYGKWHAGSYWLEMWLCSLFEDCVIINNSEGAYVESRSANQRHYPAEDYRHIRCVRGPVAPIIQTLPVIKQTTTTAELRFEVFNDPEATYFPYVGISKHSEITKAVFRYGITKDNLSSVVETTNHKWSASVGGLTPGTEYYYQPVVEYEGGEHQISGDIMSFRTYYGTLEYQNDVYYTTRLGNIEAMSQNLRSSSLNDGTAIPLLSKLSDWTSAEGPAQCIAYNREHLLEPFGRLYNGFAIQTGKVCPEGWRLPKNSEIINESNGRLYGELNTGSLFLADPNYWGNNPVFCSNDLAFSLLPSGCRYGDERSYDYYEDGFFGEFWQVFIWALNDSDSNSLNVLNGFLQLGPEGYIQRSNLSNQSRNRNGYSVRCVREIID